MPYHVATKEEAAAFWKMREELLGDGAVVSIPIMRARRTPPPAWPHLESSLKQDGYKPLDQSHLTENEDEQ